MPVITFRPHKLRLLQNDSYIDEDGNPVKVEKKWSRAYKCDAVQAGGGSEYVFEDGTRTTYSYEIVVDKKFREVKRGEKLKLELLGGVTRIHEAIGFKRFQLQCKIYV